MANEVIIKVMGDDAGASRVLDNVASKAKAAGSTMGTALKTGGLLAAAGIGAAGYAMVGFVKDAAAEQVGIAQLKTAIGTLDEAHRGSAKAVEDVVRQREKLAFSDDEIRESIAKLIPATGDYEEAVKRQRIAMDLARGTGMDLATASKLVGKVSEENTQVLKRYGITLKEGATEQEALAAIQQKFGGQAEAYAGTATAKWEIFNNQIDNIKESIGGALLPTVTMLGEKLGEFLTEHQDDIDRLSQAFAEKIPEAIAAIASAIQEVRPQLEYVFQQMKEGFQVIKPGLEWIIDNKPALVAALTAIGVAMLLAFSPVTVPILAVVAAIGALLFILGTSKEEWKKYGEAVNRMWEDLQAAIEEKLGIIGTVINAFMDIIRNDFVTAFKVIRDIVVIVMALIQGDWSKAWEGIKQLGRDILDGIITDFKIKFGLMRDIAIWAFEGIKAIIGNALSGLRDVVAYAIGAVLNYFYGLPQSIKDAIGDVTDLLYDIGKDIVSSLWDGMKDMWEDVSGWVGSLGGKIKDLKGPIDVDRVMLYDEGFAIISGLQNGMESAAQNLFSYLSGLTNRIAAAVQAAQAAVASAGTGGEVNTFTGDQSRRGEGPRQGPARVGGRTRDEWKYIFGASGIPASEYNVRLREMFGYQQGALSTIGGPAMLHPREAVMPAEMADMLRELLSIFKSGGGMGSGGVTNYIDKIEMHGDPMTGLAALGASL